MKSIVLPLLYIILGLFVLSHTNTKFGDVFGLVCLLGGVVGIVNKVKKVRV